MKNIIYTLILLICFLKIIGLILFLKEMIELKEVVSLLFLTIKKDIKIFLGIEKDSDFTKEISKRLKRIPINIICDSFYNNVILTEKKIIKLIFK